MGCILLFTQLLSYVGIYLLDNPVINRQKKIVKSQVPKFHEKSRQKIWDHLAVYSTNTVSISTLGDPLEVTYVWVKSIS